MSERVAPYGNDARARLTRQAQVTVPKSIREVLGVEAGDDLVFERRDDEIIVRRVPRSSLSRWAGAASATAPGWSSTDEELERIVSEEVAGTGRPARPGAHRRQPGG